MKELPQSDLLFLSFDVIDFYSSRAASQNFLKELAQSELILLSFGSRCITTLKIQKI